MKISYLCFKLFVKNSTDSSVSFSNERISNKNLHQLLLEKTNFYFEHNSCAIVYRLGENKVVEPWIRSPALPNVNFLRV